MHDMAQNRREAFTPFAIRPRTELRARSQRYSRRILSPGICHCVLPACARASSYRREYELEHFDLWGCRIVFDVLLLSLGKEGLCRAR